MKANFFLILFMSTLFFTSNAQNYFHPVQVINDNANHRFLIPNYGENKGDSLDYILQRDYNGKVSVFINKLTNPIGIAIIDSIAYFANDSTYILGYGLKSGKEIFKLKIEGAGQLCGVTTDGKKSLYITDFWGTNLYKVDVSNKSYRVFCGLGFKKASGIAYDRKNERLVFITQTLSSKIYEVSLTTSDIKLLYDTGIGYCDGLVIDKHGSLYSGSWKTGNLYRFDVRNEKYCGTPIVSNLGTPVYPYVDLENNSVAVPCWKENTVIFTTLP